MTSIRCSSLPLVSACAAASIPPAVRIEPPRGPADLGSAFHDCMAAVVSGQPYDLDTIANLWHVDPEQLRPMVGWARARWADTFAEMFPAASVEVPMSYCDDDLTLTGHSDIGSVLPSEIRVGDWKTGWLDVDPIDQLRGYAFLSLMAHSELPDIDSVYVLKIDVRHQYAEPRRFHRAELLDWWTWLKSHAKETTLYRPGPHCGRCPRALECPAHATALRHLSQSLVTATPTDSLRGASPDDLAQTVLLARMFEKRIEAFLKSAKAHVEAHGGQFGPLFLRDENRPWIDVARAWDVLTDALGQDTLRDLLSDSKGDLLDAFAANAPPRGKGAAKQALIARLEEAGALVRNTIQKLEVRNVRSHASGQIAE